MQIKQFNFTTSDNTRLFSKIWLPEEFNPDKVIVFHHGLGEHCDRYQNLIQSLIDQQYSFFSYDMRGHGRSEGNRGDAENIQQLVIDLEDFIYFIKKEYKVNQPILLGHSLGGLITSYFAVRHTNQEEIKALVLSAPALEVSLNFLQTIKYYIGLFLFYVKPDLILKSEINPQFLSHDKTVVQKYIDDPLVHPYLSVRLGIDIMNAIKIVHRHASKIKIPTWIGHGTMDKITSSTGSEKFFRRIRSENKVLRLYQGLYHEIFNEVTNIPLENLKAWILSLENTSNHKH
jgi:alpha-beta hydrolase superfamily lysophospholipase